MPIDAKPKPRPIPSALRVAAVGLLVVGPPFLYVSSVGPAYWMAVDDGWVDLGYLEALDKVYAPLWWLSDRLPPIQRAMTGYAGFGPTEGDFDG